MKRTSSNARALASLLVVFCLLAAPMTAFAKKGDKNFKRGMQYETAQQWEKAAQEFTLAIASDPSNVEYRLHYQRAVFNASQMYMQQGRALAEQRDYLGAYNAFRQAYGYDPVNQLALSEMERMLRLQREKTGEAGAGDGGSGGAKATSSDSSAQQQGAGGTPAQPSTTNAQPDLNLPPQQLRVIKYTGDLKLFIRSLAEQLGLNVIFDNTTFRTPRTTEVNFTDVTTAQALDLLFLQEGLFFQKVNRHTILVADQNRRTAFQQLSIRTFYLANMKPDDAMKIAQSVLPPNQGRPQPLVLKDDATNSVTVRDTPENLRLIGEVLRSMDKDRAEVVMDVGIYEVSRTDLLQLGNQIGVGDSSGFFSLGGTSGLNIIGGSRQVAQTLTNVPTALGAALVIPSTALTAFQRRDHTKLLASTQIHAFNGEESSARIGQRVPVQTAQTYPFSTVPSTTGTGPGTSTGTTVPGVFSGGFPVIQYEPTGLTLKFQPQVFPNLDVQVKMDIESKDIQNAGSLTPTFTERTITGTARIQNNRTMMLASVAQNQESNGRRGLPLLGLIPVLGRLFTSPTHNDNQIDIVIAVTPRVLRAPAVTPSDEIERPSGTTTSPTNASLEAMMVEVYREDQLAAARRIPKNVTVQLADADAAPPTYVPAPKALVNTGEAAQAQPATGAPQEATAQAIPTALTISPQPANALAEAIAKLTGEEPPLMTVLVDKKSVDAPPTSSKATPSSNVVAMPLPKLMLAKAPAVEKSEAAPSNSSRAEKPSFGEKLKTRLFGKLAAQPETAQVPAEARLMPEQQEMRVGDKQRIALVLASKASLGSTILRFRFDSTKIAVRSVSQSDWPGGSESAPTVMQSIDPAGVVTIAISPQAAAPLKPGANVLLYLEIEAIAPGDSVISFDPFNAHVTAADGRAVNLQTADSSMTVKK